MHYDMKAWAHELIANPQKKPLPVLSFPCTQLMGITVQELISDSTLQARGMKLIVDRTDPAAAVSLMDLSVEAEAFGSEIRVSADEVPTVVGAIVEEEEDAQALEIPPVGTARTGLYVDTVRKACELISDRPVLAGSIGPFSLAARLLDVTEALILCYEDPELVHAVLEKTTAFLIDYIRAFRDVGANGVLMAEPLTGMLSPTLAEEFSEPYVKRIVDAVQTDDFLVIYHNCGSNTVLMADSIVRTGAAGYHFGNAIELEKILPLIPGDRLVLGNVDPSGELCYGTPESVRAATRKVLEACAYAPNFVLSSGCDIPPIAPWENIDAFFAAAREYQP